MPTVAELIVTSLADHGIATVWGVVGDALNPVTDAIRRDGRIEWIGVRHEEVGAFAAGAQAQLTGTLGVCSDFFQELDNDRISHPVSLLVRRRRLLPA